MATHAAHYEQADDYEAPPEAEQAREAARVRTVLQSVVDRLEKEAVARVGKRDVTEQRWLANLLQFNGEYDEKTRIELSKGKRSQLFINITRPKTNAVEARLSDMLFPTDDKNWGIKPTPNPRLADMAKLADQMPPTPEGIPPDQAQAPTPEQQKAIQARLVLDAAKKRAEAMEKEIDDQLRECGYNIEARKVIRDAGQLGVGVLKGPVATDRAKRSWTEAEQTDPATGASAKIYVLGDVTDPRPMFYRVDPWGFFPDPSARSIEECESTLERHLMNKKNLRALARKPGFDKEAVKRLLQADPKGQMPQYITDLRNLTGTDPNVDAGWYQVWEYRGPLTLEEIRDICACLGKQNMVEDQEDDDPLMELQALVWFCDGELLKFGIHHLDSGECIYSVYSLDKDEVSIMGSKGIPAQVEDSQKALNAAWRMMMDNAGLTTGPQIVIDTAAIVPANGDNTLAPMKVWLKSAQAAGKNAFEIFNIDGHQAELANIIALAQKFVDDETNMPVIAQGEQGAHVTKTAQGMALLMNSINVVFRRMVKSFDDDLTVPSIRRIYDWNMQFSPEEGIKGDFEVDARGSSVLLVREFQSQNLLLMLTQFSAHPVLGPLLKVAQALRLFVKSMMLSADEVVKTDDEIAKDMALLEKQGQTSPDAINAQIETAKLTEQRQAAIMEAQTKIDLAMIERETAMMVLAGKMNLNLDNLRAQLSKIRSDERLFAGEAALKQRLGSGI